VCNGARDSEERGHDQKGDFAVALPSIQEDLGFSQNDLAWVAW
jgi:hypothetical protein